jgi:hypothetical protein
MRSNIAEHLKRNVCLCDRPSKLAPHKDFPSAWVCKDCGKFPVYYIYECIICKKDFLHDFVANFCYKDPCCWSCNPDNEPCDDHIYCVTQITVVSPPAIELKKPFTKEELDSVFNF